MRPEDAAVIANWVKAGGVLMILENDPANADLDHLNLLADRFGIHYNSVLRKHVIGRQWDLGKVAVPAGGPIFQDAHTIYVKDVSTISVEGAGGRSASRQRRHPDGYGEVRQGNGLRDDRSMALQRVHGRAQTAAGVR